MSHNKSIRLSAPCSRILYYFYYRSFPLVHSIASTDFPSLVKKSIEFFRFASVVSPVRHFRQTKSGNNKIGKYEKWTKEFNKIRLFERAMCSAFLSLTVVILACFSHLKCFFLPPEPDTPDPSSESVASYVNSSEFLAKWLEDPENQKIVAPIEDCTTETIASRMFTNTPHAEDWVSVSLLWRLVGSSPIAVD